MNPMFDPSDQLQFQNIRNSQDWPTMQHQSLGWGLLLTFCQIKVDFDRISKYDVYTMFFKLCFKYPFQLQNFWNKWSIVNSIVTHRTGAPGRGLPLLCACPYNNVPCRTFQLGPAQANHLEMPFRSMVWLYLSIIYSYNYVCLTSDYDFCLFFFGLWANLFHWKGPGYTQDQNPLRQNISPPGVARIHLGRRPFLRRFRGCVRHA